MTKEDGTKLREARRARVRMIRSRVVGGSVALFLAVWSLIAVVLITGHDPALARRTAAITSAAATTTSTLGKLTSALASSLSTTFTNPTPAADDYFGYAVAAVGTDKVLIGTPYDDTGSTDTGTTSSATSPATTSSGSSGASSSSTGSSAGSAVGTSQS